MYNIQIQFKCIIKYHANSIIEYLLTYLHYKSNQKAVSTNVNVIISKKYKQDGTLSVFLHQELVPIILKSI